MRFLKQKNKHKKLASPSTSERPIYRLRIKQKRLLPKDYPPGLLLFLQCKDHT